MTPSKNTDYKIQRECSRQWRSVLAAMAQELSGTSRHSNGHDFAHRIGQRYAAQSALAVCSNLEELQIAISARWQSMDWGWIDLDDAGGKLRIVHHGAGNGDLLAAALGDDTKVWVPSFLSGVYQQWLASLGASNELCVRQVSQVDEFGTLELELSL